MHVLLVEDHVETRHVLTKLITHWGHQVIEVETVAAAISLLKHLRFGAVVTDIGLIDGDGIQVIEEATRCRLPVLKVAITAYSDSQHRASATRAGVDHYLTKPFDSARLKAVLRRAE